MLLPPDWHNGGRVPSASRPSFGCHVQRDRASCVHRVSNSVESVREQDVLLLKNKDVTSIEWVFSRSGVTGRIGPTGPLADALDKAGILWRLAP